MDKGNKQIEYLFNEHHFKPFNCVEFYDYLPENLKLFDLTESSEK